jgi:hypothetical protein
MSFIFSILRLLAIRATPSAEFCVVSSMPYFGRSSDNQCHFGTLVRSRGFGGASIVYVKEQMGHSSVQVTVHPYGHLLPEANVNWAVQLDSKQARSNSQQSIEKIIEDALQTIEEIGGGGWTRTNDLRIMRPSL